MRSSKSRDAFGEYLERIGKIPLLTGEQEIALSRQVQAWRSHPSPSPEIERAGRRARDKMIGHNLRLVVHIAKGYITRLDKSSGLTIMDLVQEGSIGLATAVDRFDPSRGNKFSTYAYWWIRQAIGRYLVCNGRAIRLPIHLHEKLSRVKKAARSFTEKNGRIPTEPELAVEADMTIDQLVTLFDFVRTPASLDEVVRGGEYSDTPLGDLIEDTEVVSPQSAVARIQREAIVQDFLDSMTNLSEQDRLILYLKFWKGLRTDQIEQVANLPEGKGRQEYAKAMRKLRIRSRQANIDRDLISC